MGYLSSIVNITINNLHNDPTTAGELIKYFEIWLAMSRELTRGGINQYWSTETNNYSVDIPKNYGNRFNMSKNRFKLLSSAFILTNPTEQELQQVIFHNIS